MASTDNVFVSTASKTMRGCPICGKSALTNIYAHLRNKHSLDTSEKRKHWLQECAMYKPAHNICEWKQRIARCHTGEQVMLMFTSAPEYVRKYLQAKYRSDSMDDFRRKAVVISRANKLGLTLRDLRKRRQKKRQRRTHKC